MNSSAQTYTNSNMANELTTRTGTPTLLEIRRDDRTYPRICRMSVEQVALHLQPIVLMAAQYRGQVMDSNTCGYVAHELAQSLLEENKYGTRYITIQEIAIVVKKAALTEDMYGVNVSSLYKTIIAYAKGEGHRLQEQVKAELKAENRKAQERSPVMARLRAAAGEMLKTTKV